MDVVRWNWCYWSICCCIIKNDLVGVIKVKVGVICDLESVEKDIFFRRWVECYRSNFVLGVFGDKKVYLSYCGCSRFEKRYAFRGMEKLVFGRDMD